MNAEQKLAIQLKLKKAKALLNEADSLFQTGSMPLFNAKRAVNNWLMRRIAIDINCVSDSSPV
jgi:hypothetical protein